MIVVSDTSPLNYLVLIGAVETLPKLFSEVYVTPRVIEELSRTKTPDAVKLWAQDLPAWVRVRQPTSPFSSSVRLDPGETEAIALAMEIGAEAILIDERKGRSVAAQCGLLAIGTLAVMEFAAQQTLLELEPALRALRRTTFYVTDEYILSAIERDAARKRAKMGDG